MRRLPPCLGKARPEGQTTASWEVHTAWRRLFTSPLILRQNSTGLRAMQEAVAEMRRLPPFLGKARPEGQMIASWEDHTAWRRLFTSPLILRQNSTVRRAMQEAVSEMRRLPPCLGKARPEGQTTASREDHTAWRRLFTSPLILRQNSTGLRAMQEATPVSVFRWLPPYLLTAPEGRSQSPHPPINLNGAAWRFNRIFRFVFGSRE
jgi:hypothetical protein